MKDSLKAGENYGDIHMKPIKLKWTPELVRKFWDGLAHTRLLELGFSRQVGKSLITAIEHELPGDGRILDFGAGDGDLIKLLCERGYLTAAYEDSNERQKVIKQNLNQHDNFLGTIDKNSDETFNAVIMAEVIEHILDEELDETLNKIASLIKPGGVLVVTTPNNEDLELNMSYCPESNLLFHRWQHVRSFTDQSLKGLLTKYGVEEIVSHQLELNDHVFLPGDKMWSQSENGSPPSFLNEIRQNIPVKTGGEQNLLYLGRKAA